MTIVLIVAVVLGAWLLVAVVLALLIGRTIGVADKHHARTMATRRPVVRRSAEPSGIRSRHALVAVNRA